ncbi:carbonic anhydrase [Streptomyces sp. ISL-36]|uniref:carbonic anhydrase n=1 Tax=Streptomyces sp. ISL-36 TaxID=2819182 RepID=UPI001BECC12E|nr:carbonic anhydrase [Streptomyces sp. ISL-36]MBT2438906.1 carbonic anhydrase [Streptomyces sp. ISL-36]
MTTSLPLSLSRRRAVLALTAAAAVTAGAPAARAATATAPSPRPHTEKPPTAERALDELRAGNARFAALRQIHPHEEAARRAAVAVAQHPFALILGCVDSRVPPELVFDQGLGDLLAIRSAGQALDEAVLGSIQFGVEELGVPLVLVLGHERCGAATAAVEYVRTGKPVEGHLARVVEEIAPAARATRDLPGDWVENTVRANVARIRRRLTRDEAFDGARIVGARFDLDTGKVAFDPS